MPRSRCLTELPALGALDRAAGSVGRQLAQALRQAIQRGELKAGERIPSTRTLALARATVADVFDQLAAEGYLDARSGSGTWIASAVDLMAPVSVTASSAAPPAPASLPSSAQRYAAIARALSPLPAVPFSVAVPEGEAAPDDRWRRLGNRVRAGQAAALISTRSECRSAWGAAWRCWSGRGSTTAGLWKMITTASCGTSGIRFPPCKGWTPGGWCIWARSAR